MSYKVSTETNQKHRLGLYSLGLVAGLALLVLVVAVLTSVGGGNSNTTAVGTSPLAVPTATPRPTAPRFVPTATYRDHSHPIASLAWSPDGQTLLSEDISGTIFIRNKTGAVIKSVQANNKQDYSNTSIGWLPDGQTFYNADGQIFYSAVGQTWDKTGQPRSTLPEGFRAVSKDGKLLAVVSQNRPNVLLLQDKAGQIAHEIKLPNGILTDVALSPDGQTLATASFERENAPPDSQEKSGYGPGDIRVRIWQLDGTLLMTYKEYQRPVMSMVWSPDGQLLTVSTKGTTQEGEIAQIWDNKGKLVGKLEGDYDVVDRLTFSPDSSLVVGVSNDRGIIRVWNRAGKFLTTLNATVANVVAFSPDGQTLAVGTYDNLLQLWKVSY